MSNEIGIAVAANKKTQAEMIQWENMLESMKSKVADLSRQRDEIQKQIDQKVANTNIIISEQRGKIDADRVFVQGEREKLEAGKKEVASQIDVLRTERAEFQKEKDEAKVMVDKAQFAKNKVDQFIISVQRAFTVFGG